MNPCPWKTKNRGNLTLYCNLIHYKQAESN